MADIWSATGSSAVRSVLRQEGIEPNRVGRLRNPVLRADREATAIADLRRAAEETDTAVLRIAGYRRWRSSAEAPKPLAESTITRLFTAQQQDV